MIIKENVMVITHPWISPGPHWIDPRSIFVSLYYRFNYIVPTRTIDDIDNYKFVLYEVQFNYSVGSHDYRAFLDSIIIPEKIKERVRNRTAGIFLTIAFEGWLYVIPPIHAWAKENNFPRDMIIHLTSIFKVKDIYEHMFSNNLFDDTERISLVRDMTGELLYASGKYHPAPAEAARTRLEKKFICLNRRTRSHRLSMLALLGTTDILDTCYYSYKEEITEYMRNMTYNKFNKLLSRDDINKIVSPTHLDYTQILEINDTNPNDDSTIAPFYNRSLFSIINETHQSDLQTEYMGIPLMFASEKSFKGFYFSQIPIINGGRMSVKYLRDSGFDVFDDIVNHGYDDILGEDDRLLAVFEEIKRLHAKYSLDECYQLRLQLIPRFEANRQKLERVEGKFAKTIVTDLEEVFAKHGV